MCRWNLARWPLVAAFAASACQAPAPSPEDPGASEGGPGDRTGGKADGFGGAGPGETHPYQAALACTRAPGSTLVGVMWDLAGRVPLRVTEIGFDGNVGACELAIRASRKRRVCVPASWGVYTVRRLDTGADEGSYRSLDACTAVTRGAPALRTEPGYVDLIAPEELAPFRAALPRLTSDPVDAALRSPRTIWYDESSLVFVYQDSFGDPKGLRANRVGYDVGSNASEPDIHALTEYFQPQKFKFPFSVAAGATFSDNVYALYFWQPPVSEGRTLPVRIWKNGTHWQWVFPVGTVLGEALFIQAPHDKRWLAFEVRSRTRALDRWVTGVFRPFLRAEDLAAAVRSRRPGWATLPDVRALVEHLESPASLTAHTLSAPTYRAIFPDLHGAMDYLPELADPALVEELLTDRYFDDAMGTTWKQAGGLTAYAPSTHARFHVVPAEYPAGMFETSEAGCRNCHDQTSRPLNNLDPRVVLYGEVWGEDEVFTWHPFAIDADAFSVSDGNRRLNPRLQSAGLVELATPASAPQTYRALPKPYVARYD